MESDDEKDRILNGLVHNFSYGISSIPLSFFLESEGLADNPDLDQIKFTLRSLTDGHWTDERHSKGRTSRLMGKECAVLEREGRMVDWFLCLREGLKPLHWRQRLRENALRIGEKFRHAPNPSLLEDTRADLPPIQLLPSESQPFFFLHVDKSGGSTFRKLLFSSPLISPPIKGGLTQPAKELEERELNFSYTSRSYFELKDEHKPVLIDNSVIPCYHGVSCFTFEHSSSDRFSVYGGHFQVYFFLSLFLYFLY